MKLKNFTDIPDETLLKMIDFVDPGLAKDVRIVCKPSRKTAHGFSYNEKKEVVVYIPKHKRFPFYVDHDHTWRWVNADSEVTYSPADTAVRELEQYDAGNGPANWKLILHTKTRSSRFSGLVLSLEEDIIRLLAHELRHQWQRRRPLKSQWAWGCRGKRTKFSIERDSSAYGWKKVREWRRIHNPTQIFPTLP